MLAGLLWSMGGVLVKLVEEADSIQIVLYRSLFVIPVVAGFIAVPRRRRVRQHAWRGRLERAVRRGSASPPPSSTFVTALTLTTVANAAFVLATTPFLAALLGRLMLGEPVRRITWLAMALAGLGVVVIAAPGIGPGRLAGTLLALVSCRLRSPCSASPCAAAGRSTARPRC